LRLTRAGHDVVEQVMTRRREQLVGLVAATADLWQPAVTRALCAFAEAAGEPDEQDWWLGWSIHAADVAAGCEADPPAVSDRSHRTDADQVVATGTVCTPPIPP
jgi:hypothetical protein